MISFYYHPTPNPSKIALFLEETGIPYRMHPVDIAKGEQHRHDFLAINPNGKVPAIVDGASTIFDSTAILIHLAGKHGVFLPASAELDDGEMLSWMMFIASGLGPFTGQAIHFRHYAPDGQAYASNRYQFEARRHWDIIDKRLATQPYMMGEGYSIVDMSLWGWCRGLGYLMGDEAWTTYPHVSRLFSEINARPAAERVAALAASYAFKSGTDDETRLSLFRHGNPILSTTLPRA